MPSAIASKVPASVKVSGVPECGYFMDLPHWDGKPGYTPNYQYVAKMQNVSGFVNSACTAAVGESEEWKCFMAQYTLPHVRTIMQRHVEHAGLQETGLGLQT